MVVVHSMVGDMEVGETEWGDQDAMLERVKSPFDGGNSNIRVVVKIRPPNEREKALEGGVIVSVSDDGQQVIVTGKPPFTYDVAFPMECTQLEVFEKIGVDIVTTAYNGYNASMFAYGQTSSGKSFSMMGVRGTALVGLIPRISNLLFYCIKNTPEHEFFVEGSYLEIYNEKLRDLLALQGGDDLKVRENPQLGVHVAGLTKHHVDTADGVEKIIEDGTSHRTVAATKYNSESSRSHAVFELHIQQKYKDKISGEEMQSKVKIALIDLAGSERSDKLGSVGKALQEGNNINKSLTVLGRCIKALVEKANDSKKKIVVPFRESVLTYYLRESLAGNARTTMLAACSPAGSNEEETMSTLRYAASAKQIKTSAKKSEDPLKAKINELTGEVEKLRAMLAKGGGGGGGGKKDHRKSQMMNMMKGNQADAAVIHDELAHLTEEEKTAYLKELEEQMELMGLGGFKKVTDARPKLKKRASQVINPRDVYPQLSCLNKDEMLSHAMVIPIKMDRLTIGKSDASGGKNDFEIDGMGMMERHCVIEGTGDEVDKVYTISLSTNDAVVHVNGTVISGAEDNGSVTLNHLDRIILGPCRIVCLFLTEKLTAADRTKLNYALAFREFMSGDTDASRLLMSPRRQALLDHVQEVDGVMLKQANAIAAELCTTIQFASHVLVGAEGFNNASITIDELLDANEQVRIKVCCVAGLDSINSKEDQINAMKSFQEKEKDQMTKKSSTQNLKAALDSELDAGGIKVNMDQLLFELQSEDFGDLLAELKATHNSLGSLLGGVGASTSGAGMIRSVFEAVDTDQSGSIDKYELQACIEKFNVQADPTFFKHVLREEGIKEEDELDFDRFEAFLIRFLQHQFYKKIESYVTNKGVFMKLGGRSVIYSHRGTILENKSRHSMFHASGKGSSVEDDDEEGEGDEDEEEDKPEVSEEEQERIARQKKLGREAKQARMRQRMRQNAVVTNFITTLKGDLQKAMGDLEEFTEGDRKGAAEKSKLPVKLGGKKKKKKSEKDVYAALADKIKKAIKDLEAQHKTTVMVSKERDQLEDYLTRMLAERDAMIPDGGSDEEEDNTAFSLPGLGGAGGGGGFMDRPGKAMDL